MSQIGDQLLGSVAELLASEPIAGQPLCVGYSGGIDSTVLLHLVSRLNLTTAVRAIHVNHGLQPQAESWQAHCAEQCAQLGVAFVALSAAVEVAAGQGPEAAARAARYAAVRSRLGHGEVLLTGHHQRDQLETVLLAMLRGSGPEGLAAMPPVIRRHGVCIARPLLTMHPNLIRAYANEQQLSWVEDGSNADPAFDRNYLRSQVLPALELRWPSAPAAASRSARWCAEAAATLRELAVADAAAGLNGQCLKVASLSRLSRSRQRNLLRHIGRELGLPVPQAAQLEALLDAVLRPATHLASSGHWPGVVVRRYRDQLWFYRASNDPAAIEADATPRSWVYPDELRLGDAFGSLRWQPSATGGISADFLATPLEVRRRAGGERLRLHRGGPRRSLNKLWQELGVVPWMRGHVPLVYAGEELLAAGDLLLNADCCVPEGEAGMVLAWRNKPELR